MKTITNTPYFTVAVCGVVLLALSPGAQAVSPAPDGGYPGGNTAEGQNALLSLTSGGYNTAVGYFSLRNNTTAQFNTAVGAGALLANTGGNNTAIGAGALLSNSVGSNNTANGMFALLSNTTGSNNTATGQGVLQSNTTGYDNTAHGFGALFANADGTWNTAVGNEALLSNVGGSFNTAIGTFALHISDADSNTAVGYQALHSNTIGAGNTAVGDSALLNSVQGGGNTAVGQYAGENVDGSFNICIGEQVFGNSGESNTIHIGDSSNPDVAAAVCYIGGIFGATSVGGSAVFVNSAGQLGTVTCSARFKDDIKPLDKDSESIFALKPVRFRYKKEIDPTGSLQFGLIAEQVEKVDPELIIRGRDGKPYTVRYDAVNAMLLSEFLKEHKKVEAQQATIAKQRRDFEAAVTQLNKQMETVVARLKEQDSKIQKVRDEMQMSRSDARLAITNH